MKNLIYFSYVWEFFFSHLPREMTRKCLSQTLHSAESYSQSQPIFFCFGVAEIHPSHVQPQRRVAFFSLLLNPCLSALPREMIRKCLSQNLHLSKSSWNFISHRLCSSVISSFMFGWCIHHLFFSYVYLLAMATSKKVLYVFLSEAASFVRWNILDVTLWCFTPQFARSLCFLQLLSLSCHAVSLLTVSSTGLSAFWILYKPCAFVSCVVACVCLTGSAPQCTEARIFGDYLGAVHGFALLIWSGPHFFVSMQWWQRYIGLVVVLADAH